MSEFATLLATLVILHALCDYPLQGDFLANAKNPLQPIPGIGWAWAMSAHCAIHAGAVWFVTGSSACGLAEFGAHFALDTAKCHGRIGFSTDQVGHLACKVAFALWCTCAT